MRNAALRSLRRATAGGALVLAASGALTGCGLLGGDNSAAVCTDAKKALQQYVSQVRSLPANQPAPWRQPVEQLSGKLDGLSAKAEKPALKKALKDEATRLRTAAAPMATGDVSAMNDVMKTTPDRLGGACE